MELNDKIAARRKELAEAGEKARIDQAQQRQQSASAKSAAQLIEKEAIDSAVAQRLAEHGITLPQAAQGSPPNIDVEVDKALTKAASDRMTSAENTLIAILVALGFTFFFFAWWLGLITLWISYLAYSGNISRHKKEILAEGEARMKQVAQGDIQR